MVIGGGMTAIDAAIQARLLGGRRSHHLLSPGQGTHERFRMGAGSRRLEGRRQSATGSGPAASSSRTAKVAGIDLEYTMLRDGRLVGTGESMWIDADQIFKAIGQSFDPLPPRCRRQQVSRSTAAASSSTRKAAPRPPWSGPAATATGTGEDLTVTAVAQGRDAAESIHRALTANGRA